MKILERLVTADIGPDTRRVLQSIERSRGPGQTYTQKPSQFKFTLRDDKKLNHTDYADIFYIEDKPFPHIVDESKNLQSVRWLTGMSSETLWRAMLTCWIEVYLGPSDLISHDARKDVMGAAFQASAGMLHIRTKSLTVKSANSMTIEELYHSLFRPAFNIIRKEAPKFEKGRRPSHGS